METELLKQIENYDTISFDIFDTLIMRRTLYPHDIFRIVEEKAKKENIPVPSFYESRIQAEQNLIAEIPNIYELYEEFKRITGISDRDCRRLLELELETEHDHLIRRDRVCRLMDAVHDMGKEIFLISDMYIPEAILLDWLKELGITKFRKAFISCEYHRPKVNGLYEICRKATGETRHLHIGDNEIYDGKYAGAAGMDTFIIESAASSLKMHCPVETEPFMEQAENRMALGLLAAGFYNNPFAEMRKKPVEIKNILDMAEYAVAPMLSGLVLWLVGKLTEGKYDGLLLAARDGYLVYKMLKIYEDVRGEKLPRYCYFYTSRAACAASVIESKADFVQAVRRPSSISLWKCVQERLEINPDETEDINVYYARYEKKIMAESAKLRKRYQRYALDMGISPEGNYLFFDFVSSGTCLYMLNKILGLKMTGAFCYRYGRHDPEGENQRSADASARHIARGNQDSEIESFLDEEQGKQFWKYYKIFETIMTSPDGMFLRLDKCGKPVFAKDLRTEQEKSLAKEMQDEVLNYWRNLLKFESDDTPSRDLLIHLTELLNEKYTFCSDWKKDILFLYDSFESGKIKVFS